jgi:predicted GIY-YIG superfamily endonuclease
MFYVYILKCKDQSYYVGHADDLEKRLSEHTSGAMHCYTLNRRPIELVFTQEFSTREEAFAAERQLKGWSRAKKEALILNNWRLISCLSKKRFK